MPQPSSPPYGIGSLPPRQLNRWLDVNSQNGPLTRTRGNIVLPLNGIPFDIIGPALATISVTNTSGGNRTYNIYDVNNVLLASEFCVDQDTIFFENYPTAYSISFTPGGLKNLLPYEGWAGDIVETGGFYNFAVTNKPVSEKFLQFNYASDRVFSLKRDAALQQFIDTYEGQMIICITYIDEDNPFNTVHRYNLTSTSGREFINAIPYDGQKIKGLFQIEFWGRLDHSFVLNITDAPVTLDTSILGEVDYRFGVDFSISPTTVTVTNFYATGFALDIFTLPFDFPDNTISGLN